MDKYPLSEVLKVDFQKISEPRKFSCWGVLRAMSSQPGFLAVMLLRLQESAVHKNSWKVAQFWRNVAHNLTGADFVPGCQVGKGVVFHHPNGIVIGKGTRLGENCVVMQGVTFGEKNIDSSNPNNYPSVGDNCIIGAGAVLLGGIKIGHNVTVGANAVVISDVPSNSVAVGVPATFKKKSL